MSDDPLFAPLVAGDRRALAKAITLIESTRVDHRQRADALVAALLSRTGNSLRIGISGVPGVGKSTFIEALGMFLIERNQRPAVLAVDPSSTLTGGSILGDKTRMERLASRPEAFIRPSPSSGSLGGVAEHTREAILLCEAAGHDVVIVETVGVGQSEIAVAAMTDLFVLMQLPNAGDELQAIKKGIVALAALGVDHKADLDDAAAHRAAAQMRTALSLLRHADAPWQPAVLTLSALEARGIDAFWGEVTRFCEATRAAGTWAARRRHQALDWMWQTIDTSLRQNFRRDRSVRAALPAMSAAVEAGKVPPATAARQLLALNTATTHSSGESSHA